MSNALISAAFATPGLTTAQKMVLVALADEVRDRHGNLCWPGMETIAAKSSMTERGARGVVKQLVALGLIQISVQGGRGRSNRYLILADKTLNRVPCLESVNPEHDAGFIAETRKETALNPEPPSGEPLGTLKVGGGGGVNENDLTFRERILIASGHDQSGFTATGRIIGSPTDMMAVAAWRRDLGLTDDEILSVIGSVAAQPRYQPVGAFKYFDGPMQRLAGAKAAPKLAPIAGRGRAAETPQVETRQQMAHRVLARLAAEEGI